MGPLVCSACKGRLAVVMQGLGCATCHATYSVIGDVAVMLPESLTDQQESQRAYFDSEFGGYDSYMPEKWRRSFITRIFSALGVGLGDTPYLDVGVGGSGATVIEAARKGEEAYGCDLSVEGVLHANRFAASEGVAGRAHFVACAAEALPFADSSFAAASAVAVLEHLDDDAAAARELHRVLRPGGRLWVTVPNAYRFIPPPVWPVYKLHDRRLGHRRHYDVASLTRLLGGAGFRHVSTSFTGHPVKIAQVLLERLLPVRASRRDRIWWALESLDLRASGRALGALQLNSVFERPG